RAANMRGPRSCPAPWLAGPGARYGAANFRRALGSSWLPPGQARRPSATGWVHRLPSACSELANCREVLEWTVTLNAPGRPYRFKTSSERRGRPTRRGTAGLETGAHGRMFGEYAFMKDSCNASPELFCQGKRMNFSSREAVG